MTKGDTEIEDEMRTDDCHVKCTATRKGKGKEQNTIIDCRILKGTPQKCGWLNEKAYEKIEKDIEE